MKKYLYLLALLPGMAGAADVNLSWTLPTTASNGSPLTGVQALTSVQVFLATSTIGNASTMLPTATLTASSTTTTQTITANVGQTLFARIKACNSVGCSSFSGEVSKVVPGAVPGIPTQVTIEITIQ